MAGFRDRLLLITVALLVGALLFCYFSVALWLGIDGDAQILVLQTLGLAAFTGSIRRTSPWRGRKLRLKWPLIAASIGLLLVHLATVGSFVMVYHPRWRGPHWSVITMWELVVFGVVLSAVHEFCTMDRRPSVSAFLFEQLRIAIGRIDDSPRH